MNSVLDYGAHKNPNVMGTLELLRVATTVKLKPYYFVSRYLTYDINSITSVSAFQCCHSHPHPDEEFDILSLFNEDRAAIAGYVQSGSCNYCRGYAQSKYVAEVLLYRAGIIHTVFANSHLALRGVPIAILRPGLIFAHSQTGVANTRDWYL